MVPVYAIVLLMLLLNIWVWFFPSAFIKFIKIGKGAKIESIFPTQKSVWKFVDLPTYIWFPRFIFSISFIVSIGILYYIYTVK